MKTLLLNSNFEVLAFISERKAIRLLLKEKADVLSVWAGRKICSVSGYMEHPATLRMRYYIPLKPTKLSFSRKLILRRDQYQCCYCLSKHSSSELTIDHIIPKSQGGKNSFLNCVSACRPCNLKKKNRTPEEAGFILKIKPKIPQTYLCYLPLDIEWHDDWLFYTRSKS